MRTSHFGAEQKFRFAAHDGLLSPITDPGSILPSGACGGASAGRHEKPGLLKGGSGALRGVLSHTRRIILSGIGHMAADDVGEPERVATELLSFFARESVSQSV